MKAKPHASRDKDFPTPEFRVGSDDAPDLPDAVAALLALFRDTSERLASMTRERPSPRSVSVLRSSPEHDPVNAFIHRFDLPPIGSGPLDGRMVAVKDTVAVAGVPRTRGRSDEREWQTPQNDATIIQRILRAGGTITGTLNMDIWGCGATGETSEFGLAKNPRATDRLPGGSSSGSAAALAAGLVDLAIGTDTAGSARIPASWCGVVGLKPTHGAVPDYGVVGLDPTFDDVCPMARTVDECANFFEVLAGRAAPGPVSTSLRVGIVQGTDGSCDAATVRALHEASEALESQDLQVEEIEIGLWESSWAIESILLACSAPYLLQTGFQGRWTLDPVAPPVPPSARPPQLFVLWQLVLESLGEEANTLYFEAQEARLLLEAQVAEAFEQVDLLLTPTTPTTAPQRGTSVLTSTLTAPANVTGIPAIAVPFGLDEGIPRSVQLHSRRAEEGSLLAAARILEATSR